MKIRPPYPDELARAKSLLGGHPVPPHASFLVAVKEHPVERLVATIPWWKAPVRESDDMEIRFSLATSGAGGLTLEALDPVLSQLEEIARAEAALALHTDFSLLDESPLLQQLHERGFEICQTDCYFSWPGETGNERCLKVYERARSRMPDTWKVESIREHQAEEVFALVSESNLMTPQRFQSYWNFANRERFEEKYSCVVVQDGKIISALLVTQPRADELHIHVDVVSSEFFEFSGLLTLAMRHYTCSNTPEGFPRIFSCRADSQQHRQTANTALRYGGEEHRPRHLLRKSLSLA